MVDPKKKGKYIGMVGALLVHVAFILLLILVGFVLPEQQDEDGMPVMLGEVPNAFGSADPSLVKVDVMPDPIRTWTLFLRRTMFRRPFRNFPRR